MKHSWSLIPLSRVPGRGRRIFATWNLVTELEGYAKFIVVCNKGAPHAITLSQSSEKITIIPCVCGDFTLFQLFLLSFIGQMFYWKGRGCRMHLFWVYFLGRPSSVLNGHWYNIHGILNPNTRLCACIYVLVDRIIYGFYSSWHECSPQKLCCYCHKIPCLCYSFSGEMILCDFLQWRNVEQCKLSVEYTQNKQLKSGSHS